MQTAKVSSGGRGNGGKAGKPSVGETSSGDVLRIAVGDGDVHLVLELRGARTIAPAARRAIEKALWESYNVYVSDVLQDQRIAQAELHLV